MNHAEENRAMWDARADLGMSAGTNDVRAKRLEMRAISEEIPFDARVLDVGCGNGITAVHLAGMKHVSVVGIDHSAKMIDAAQELAESEGLLGTVEFRVGDALHIPTDIGLFDVAITERTLVNIQDWSLQTSAIYQIRKTLKVGGRYLMVECSSVGLAALNKCRENAGLSRIVPPPHTRYINDDEVADLFMPGMVLERKVDFTSSYYFISRVVNAWQAKQLGQEPSYDAPVNALADLIPSVGDVGQVRMWVWRAR